MTNPTVKAALISAGIAAAVSAGTTYWTLEREIDKVVLATQQNALHKIIDARLTSYQTVYRLISQLAKDARKRSLTLEYFEKLLSEYDSWDSSFGYLLGPESTNTAFNFRQHLSYLVSSSLVEESNIQELLSNAGKLELALRSDLGIYGFQLQGPNPDLSTPKVEHY